MSFAYDVDTKALSEDRAAGSVVVSISDLSIDHEPLDRDPNSALSLAVGYTYDEAVEKALSVLEEFLREFVAARDGVDWWFANPVGELHGAGGDLLEGVSVDLGLED